MPSHRNWSAATTRSPMRIIRRYVRQIRSVGFRGTALQEEEVDNNLGHNSAADGAKFCASGRLFGFAQDVVPRRGAFREIGFADSPHTHRWCDGLARGQVIRPAAHEIAERRARSTRWPLRRESAAGRVRSTPLKRHPCVAVLQPPKESSESSGQRRNGPLCRAGVTAGARCKA